jgi:hypothetical protein
MLKILDLKKKKVNPFTTLFTTKKQTLQCLMNVFVYFLLID